MLENIDLQTMRELGAFGLLSFIIIYDRIRLFPIWKNIESHLHKLNMKN